MVHWHQPGSLVSGGCCTCSSRNRKDATNPELAPQSHLTQEAGQGEAPRLLLWKSKQDVTLYFPHNVHYTSVRTAHGTSVLEQTKHLALFPGNSGF